jgi:hypothetical protein
LCFLLAFLFSYQPFLGESRSLGAGREAFRDLGLANTRLKIFGEIAKVTVATANKLEANARLLCGSISREPLLADGATFDLTRVRVAPAVLHNVAQVFMLVKQHLNTCLPVGQRLDVKGPFMSCAERRIEMSHWPKIYVDLDERFAFIPDCASQLSATMWQASVATPVDAVRAQVCGLVLFYVLASKSPGDVDTNYLHNVSAHLFDFVMAVASLGGRAVDFFEEAGERETQPIRTFVQRNSNYRNNLFLGARVAEYVTGLLASHRRRSRVTAPAEMSNLLLSPCIVSVFDMHVESLCSFVERVAVTESTKHLVVEIGGCVLFLVGEGEAGERVTFVCHCGSCSVPDGSDAARLVGDLPADHWLKTQSIGAAMVPQLDAQAYDNLANMIASPVGLVPHFDLSPALLRVVDTQPKTKRSALLNKKKAAELKMICNDYNIPDNGGKEVLVARILAHEAGLREQDLVVTEAPKDTYRINYDSWTLNDLRKECEDRGLTKGGNKAAVIARLTQAPELAAAPGAPKKPKKRTRKESAERKDDGDFCAGGDGLALLADVEAAATVGRRNRKRTTNRALEEYECDEHDDGEMHDD